MFFAYVCQCFSNPYYCVYQGILFLYVFDEGWALLKLESASEKKPNFNLNDDRRRTPDELKDVSDGRQMDTDRRKTDELNVMTHFRRTETAMDYRRASHKRFVFFPNTTNINTFTESQLVRTRVDTARQILWGRIYYEDTLPLKRTHLWLLFSVSCTCSKIE